MGIAIRDYGEKTCKNPYICLWNGLYLKRRSMRDTSFPGRRARLAGIVISDRHLSLAFKVWQRTVAHGGRG